MCTVLEFGLGQELCEVLQLNEHSVTLRIIRLMFYDVVDLTNMWETVNVKEAEVKTVFALLKMSSSRRA